MGEHSSQIWPYQGDSIIFDDVTVYIGQPPPPPSKTADLIQTTEYNKSIFKYSLKNKRPT